MEEGSWKRKHVSKYRRQRDIGILNLASVGFFLFIIFS
jgi:hypothetical protein